MVSSSVDVLEEIWLRLPVRSLLVFKCVSKQWCALISDPCFCRRYSVRNRKQSIAGLFVQDAPYRSQVGQTFLFIDGSKRNNAISNTFVPYEKSLPCIRDSEYQTIQSCNGLLCCRTSFNNSTSRISNPSTNSLFFLIGNSSTNSYTPRPSTFYIYNPSTNHYKILLPPPSRKEGFMWVSSVSLAFDPQKSPYYEAIAIWGDTPDGAQAEIYSSKTESWKDLGIIGARHSHCFRDCGVYWNGALHWFNIFRGLYFDISRKLLKRLPIPDIYGESIQTYKGTNIETWNVYFGECNGHLHLIKIYGLENIPTDLYILELERDYSAWT
ncbi:F-box protein At5g07610-like, partial [Papaver somniferum]